MWVYFNKYGQVRKQLDHGMPFRQGAVGTQIVAVFDGGIVSANREATISFRRPSGEIVENTYVMDYVSNKEFSLLPGEQNIYPFADDESYPAYVFTVNDSSIFSETGIYEVTIKVYYGTENENQTGNVLVVGLLSINVELAVYPEEYVLDTTEFDILMSAIANKMSKSGGIITVPGNISQADFSEYSEGQIVYGTSTNSLYELGSEKEPVLIIDLNECVPYTGATKNINIGVHTLTAGNINSRFSILSENGFITGFVVGGLENSTQYSNGVIINAYNNSEANLWLPTHSGTLATTDDVVPRSDSASILYGTTDTGAQTTYTMRDVADQIEGIILSDYYTKTESDGRYVQKTSETNVVYATDNNGDDTDQMEWSYDNGGYTFAVRYAGGKLSVGTPQYDNDAATKKYVDDNLQDVREVAEGKCHSFVFSDKVLRIENGEIVYIDEYDQESTTTPDFFYVYNETTKEWEDKYTELRNGDYDSLSIVNSSFNSQNAEIDLGNNATYLLIGPALSSELWLLKVSGWQVGISSFPLHTGDVFLIIETDVPDRWIATISGQVFYKLETSKVDLDNYVDRTTSQNIGGAKTFTDPITISGGDGFVLSTSGYSAILGLGVVNTLQFNSGALWTNVANFDLGTSSHKWRDIYFSGELKDGTRSLSFENLYKMLFNYNTYDKPELKWNGFNNVLTSTNLTFTLQTKPGGSSENSSPEYKGNIYVNDGGAGLYPITLTFKGVSKIMCNDDNITIVEGTNSTMTFTQNTTIEFSIVGRNMVAINWSAN